MSDEHDSATRHVTRRDGRLEGEPDVEPDTTGASRAEIATKENQRDLTSLSGPEPLEGDGRRDDAAESRH